MAVYPPAGLYTSTPQTAAAAEPAAPVASAGDAVAQRAVDEYLKIHTVGYLAGHDFYLVNGEFPGKHHLGKSHLFCRIKPHGKGAVGQGGEVELPFEINLPGQGRHCRVLDDQGMGMDIFVEFGQQPPDFIRFSLFDKGVECHVELNASVSGKSIQPGELFHAEIAGFHAGGKNFKPAIYGIGPGGNGGQESIFVTSRRQDLGF